MERRIKRFLPADGRKVAEGEVWGHVQLEGGKLFARRDVIEKEFADAVLFVQQALGFAGTAELWGMNIYEFHRLAAQAKTLQQQRLEALKKQKNKGNG
jgi:hypothetical protein